MKTILIASAAVALALAAAPSHASDAFITSFDRADLNGDGAISEVEYRRTQGFIAQQFFFRADRDNDRSLTPQEFKTVRRLGERRSYRSGD